MEPQLSIHDPSIFARLLAPVGQCLTPEVARHLVDLRAERTCKPASKNSQINARKDNSRQKNGLSMKRPLLLWNALACCKRRHGAY